MAKVAQYVTMLDDAQRFPTAETPEIVLQFRIDNLAATDPSILFFRVQAEADNVRLRIRLNTNAIIVDRPFPKDSAPRSIHEIMSRNQLREGGNELFLSVTGGTVVISDFVILYHANVPTGPVVANP